MQAVTLALCKHLLVPELRYLRKQTSMPASTQRTPVPGDEQLIRAVQEDFVRFYVARDVDKLMTLFSEDGRVLAPFRSMNEGKSGLRHIFSTSFAQYDPKNLNLVTVFVEVCGHLAFGYGTYQMNIKLPDGTRMDDRGKWVASLRRVGATWKMVLQTWNSDLPMTAFLRRAPHL